MSKETFQLRVYTDLFKHTSRLLVDITEVEAHEIAKQESNEIGTRHVWVKALGSNLSYCYNWGRNIKIMDSERCMQNANNGEGYEGSLIGNLFPKRQVGFKNVNDFKK